MNQDNSTQLHGAEKERCQNWSIPRLYFEVQTFTNARLSGMYRDHEKNINFHGCFGKTSAVGTTSTWSKNPLAGDCFANNDRRTPISTWATVYKWRTNKP